jgi:AsmA-like C-terminal region
MRAPRGRSQILGSLLSVDMNTGANYLPVGMKNRWIKIGAAVVVAVLAMAAVVIGSHWPFTRDAVVQALEQTFASSVDVQSFRGTYFTPGCVMGGVTFRRNLDGRGPAIATAAKLTIKGSYAGFFTFPKRISRVTVEGLQVFASAESERLGKQALPSAEADQTKVVIGEITADGTVLEFSSGEQGAVPAKFEIHKLTLNGAGDDRAMAFHAALKIPTPPGEIRADGQFGPLQRDDVGKTAASGEYTLEHADLGVFPAIGGTLSSNGKFGGVLSQLEVEGETETPNFEVDRSGHAVDLKTHFAATVDGMNGDVALKSVRIGFGKTALFARGNVAGKPAEGKAGANPDASQGGKTVSLAGTQQNGTIQDWLKLLAKAEHPAMTGAMEFRAQVRVPPGERSFIQRVNLTGDFTIGSAGFTKPTTQKAVDNLSQVAQGAKPEDDPASIEESMQGHVEMKNAQVTFTDLYFGVPGARAHMHGTYGILTEKIDLHGHLRVDHKLSNGSSGVKGALLKVAEQFFRSSKKVQHAEIVPIKMGGTFSQPTYGLDILK